MGVLNVTPDSFSERGVYFDRRAAIARALEMEREGADLIDIGGESTRPGSLPVSPEEEIERTVPVIETLRSKGLRIPISIDTTKAAVAERALLVGAEIVNDVSGLRYDPALAAVVRKHRAAIVLMHIRGAPSTMQTIPPARQIIPSVRRGLLSSLQKALSAGIPKRRICLDPGIGFGKTLEQNFELIAHLHRLASLGFPLLVGPSRKSFLRKTLESSCGPLPMPGDALLQKQGLPVPEELLFGTAAAVTACILHGAHIVRVHDVRQMLPVVRIADQFLSL